ncbi:MAG: DNA-directed RNA polymerase subunit alpha [Candidatus Woesebacteria bacterium GW2011_GWC2_47_16]|nr:MAG: DNA-directed RNA polymerase subunit alpha [Candidatus Woesebacteria bacterium GW2011_GWC2_47_16]
MTPKEATVSAAKTLVSYFNQIVSPKKVEKKEVKEEADVIGPMGKLSVEEIGLPTRVANALVKAGYETVEELAKAKKEDLVKVRNLGEKSIKIITVALVEKGVKFGE